MIKSAYLFLLIPVFPFLMQPGKVSEHIYNFSTERKLLVGEELTYEVSYSLLKLGKVVLKVKDKKTLNGKTYYSTVAHIDSYSGIPFVDLHQIYESRVNQLLHSDYFRGLVKYDKYTSYTEYKFNYDKSLINVQKGKVYPPELWTDSVTSADKKYQDGLSIFYYARMNFGEHKSVRVPCFVNEEKVYTTINFYNTVEDVDIDAVDYDIACLHLDGETDFISVFGLTGYFEGWFTNDEASIPVIAKMKVIIGNVTLELKQWKREGWKPPRYTN